MRLTSVRIAGVVVLAILILGTSPPRELEDADSLLEKHLYQEALGVYEGVLEETDNIETRETVFLRICECLVNLDRYGEVLERILAWEIPQAPDQRVRLLIYRAKALSSFRGAYARILRSDVIDEEDRDVYRLTPDELNDMIEETFRELWGLRHQLVNMKTTDEGVILIENSIHPGLFPTLFDYLITEWTGFLLGDSSAGSPEDVVKVDAGLLLVEDFDRPVDLSDPPALLAAELLEEASRFHPEGRVQAGELRKILRLRLPLNYPGRFDFSSLADDKASPDGNLYGLYAERSRGILLGWMAAFTSGEARAEAGYQAAVISDKRRELVEAVEICDRLIEEFFPKTRGGMCAEALRARIVKPKLDLRTETVTPPGTGAFIVTSKNVRDVHFRIYEVDPYQLRDVYREYRERHKERELHEIPGWSTVLDPRWLSKDWGEAWLRDFTSDREPYREWQRPTSYADDYRSVEDTIDPPALVPGIYLALASGDDAFKPHKSLLSAGFLNVTKLVLLGSAGVTGTTRDGYHDFISGGTGPVIDSVIRLYSFDAQSGEVARDIDVSAVLTGSTWEDSEGRLEKLATDSRGVLALEMPVGFKRNAYSRFAVNPLAEADNSYAYWSNSLWAYYRTQDPISVFVEIDRPIYQPGDEVKARVVVVKRRGQGFETWGGGTTLEFIARDANRKEIFKETVKLGLFGSASTSFIVPHGRLLGKYHLEARYTDGGFGARSTVSFSVEEYKRPEFEITLDPAAEAWKYHQPVEIRGKAAYYFGGPVPDAPITYRVKRRRYVPYWYRYWYWTGLDRPEDEIARGEVTTAPDGTFSIPFVPKPSADVQPWRIPRISQFTVEIEGRDAGGRTIEAGRTYRAGERSLYLVLEPSEGFFSEKDTIRVSSGRLTINDMPEGGKGEYEVFALDELPEPSQGDKPRTSLRWGPCAAPPLEVQLQDAPNAELVAHGELEHGDDGAATIVFGPLPSGAYRLVETTADAWGDSVSEERIIVVTGGPETAVTLDAYSVTLFERATYEVGDVARCLIGSGRGSGIYRVEVWSGEYLVYHDVVEGDRTVRGFDVEVTEDLMGGFTVRWFGVRDLEVHCGRATAAVPWLDKQLAVTLDPFDAEMKPGQEYKWGVSLTDRKGKPVQGEVLALMYDRSLEYYVEGRSRWLDALYAMPMTRLALGQSALTQSAAAFHIDYARHTCPTRPGAPRLRIYKPWITLGRYLGHDVATASVRSVSLEDIPALQAGVVLGDGAHIRGGREGEAIIYVDGMAETPASFEYEEEAAALEARAEFADAAFFEPHLVTAANGRAEFTFTAPEQLTAWKVKVFAHTREVEEGSLVREAVTRKDLIVRADLPRFFREGDEGTVTAIVHNESESAFVGEVFIDVTQGGEKTNATLGLADNKKHFDIEPHGLEAFDWRVKIPSGIGTYSVRVAAVSQGFSDAEEREVPILPSRQRLIESAFDVLTGSESKNLELRPGEDPTRRNELVVLQIEPQLALSILNAIPFLIEYPYGCVEQILNRYVPLSIVNEIYDDYPEIRRAVGRIPKRKTPVPPWEQDDPRRLMTLVETPWVWQSEGRRTRWPLIDLLDPAIVELQKEANLARLREAQLSNGGFPWWPGGRADTYMTLYVLAGFAEAKKYGVDVPYDVIDRALGYVNGAIEHKNLGWHEHLPLIAYACYVMTAYSPKEVPEAKSSHALVREWLDILDKVVGELRPLSKAYVAYAHYRLGNEARAQEVLDMALDGAREDPIVGIYWTPEKYSWVWYSDTVEKHAFFLRALQDMRPDDERIPGIVKWLLFNRKGNVWKSTKASAAAVYALLDRMRLQGALSADEVFEVGWGGETHSAVVQADNWLDGPIRWEERGFEIGEEDLQVAVEKRGPGTAFASLTWIYSTDQLPEASGAGLLTLERRFYRRVREEDAYHLKPVTSGGEVAVGDEIEVQLKINSRSRFEYMHLKDVKASGFEAERLLSGWRRDPIGFYEEPRHSLTNFFLSWLPHGEYILRYRLKPTKPGTYRIGAATLQSMYAPEMTAHSEGFVITVTE